MDNKMKKSLLLFVLVIALSCKKEPSYCWRCDLYSTYGGIIKSTTYCDKTAAEIVEMERLVTGYKCSKY
jgi:hypothetical protein